MTSTAVARISAADPVAVSKPLATNVDAAMASTAGTNRAETRSARRCTGAFEPCAAATWRTIAASSVDAPTAVASQRSGPDSFTVPASTAIARRFRDRNAFAGQHRLVDRRLAAQHAAVDRDAIAGAHDEHDRRPASEASGTSLRLAVALAQHGRGLQLEQIADRIRRPGPRAPLEELAEEHERDHDGGRLEVDVLSGQRHEPHGDAVRERGRRAERDQHVHVRGAAAQRFPRTGVEARAGPELHRRRERELERRRAIIGMPPSAIATICTTNGSVSTAATTKPESSRRYRCAFRLRFVRPAARTDRPPACAS